MVVSGHNEVYGTKMDISNFYCEIINKSGACIDWRDAFVQTTTTGRWECLVLD